MVLNFTFVDADPLSILLQIHAPVSEIEWIPLLVNAILFLLLLGGSFFSSSSEVAFFSLSKSESDAFKEDDSPSGKKVWWMINNHKQLIATVLITNNFVNIFAILIATYMLHTLAEHFGLSEWQEKVIDLSVISTFLLLFAEIVPKVYASRHKLQIIALFHTPMYALMKFYSPLTNLLINTTKFIDRRFQPKQENASIDDLMEAIDLMPEPVKNKEDGREILRGVLNFRNTAVNNVMITRTKIVALSYNSDFQQIVSFINENEFSRIPVYEESLDDIKGVLYIKDLLPLLPLQETNPEWQHLIRPAYFVPEGKKIDKLLEEFKQKRYHLAIVVDEYGGTAGMVTLEDITDEIFGEIRDEFDTEDATFQRIDETHYRFEASTLLNDVSRVLELDEDVFEKIREEENINSLGGLILLLNEKLPAVGQVVICELTNPTFEFTIESVSHSRIESVLVTIVSRK